MRNRPRSAVRAPNGFTLVETVVALVLMALMAGLAAASFPPPSSREPGERERVVVAARSMAMRRAQVLDFSLDARGRWTLVAEQLGVPDTINTGQLMVPGAPFAVRIDALGTCLPRTTEAWDALACRAVTSR